MQPNAEGDRDLMSQLSYLNSLYVKQGQGSLQLSY
jgi:hypothetical protein